MEASVNNELGMKELYEVTLKTTLPIEVNGRIFETGETVARFDKIQLGSFTEDKRFFSANGGYENTARVWWEDTKEVAVNIIQGIFSSSQLAIMSNANLVTINDPVILSQREIVETNENGMAILTKEPQLPIFVYRKDTGEKIANFSYTANSIVIGEPYAEFIVDYAYQYDGGYRDLTVGRAFTNGYLSLEGKTRVKDDITGQTKTGIIRIPKLKLMSDLSIRLGKDAMPTVGRLNAVAVPDGRKGNKKVMEILFLNDDIDSDM